MIIGVVMDLFSCGCCCKLHVCPGEEKFLSYLIFLSILYQTARTLKELVTIRDSILNKESSESKKISNNSEALQESG